MEKKKLTLRLTQNALLCACAVVLSIFESFIPDMPFIVPGMKPGLANIVTMAAIEGFGFSSSLYVTIAKSVFVLITRGFTAFLMSFSGGLASMLVMYLLLKSKYFSFGCIGSAVAGAFTHNMAQLAAASIITGTLIFSYTPVISLISLAAGSITGTAVYFILPPVLNAVQTGTVRE